MMDRSFVLNNWLVKITEEPKTISSLKVVPPPEYRISPEQATDEEAVKNALHIIFKKIASKETTRQGSVSQFTKQFSLHIEKEIECVTETKNVVFLQDSLICIG